MTPNRPQTLINTGFFVFGFAVKRLFLGQVSLKLSLISPVKVLPMSPVHTACHPNGSRMSSSAAASTASEMTG